MAPKRKQGAASGNDDRVKDAQAKAGAYLDANATCPICTEWFEVPVSTPCGHNFCQHCFSTAWETSKRCPTCRGGVPVKLAENKFIATTIDEKLMQLENTKRQEELGRCLTLAARYGRAGRAKALIDLGVDVNAEPSGVDFGGVVINRMINVCTYYVSGSWAQTVGHLLDAGAEAYVADLYNICFHLASPGAEELAYRMIHAGVPVTYFRTDGSGSSTLTVCIGNKNEKLAVEVVKRGAAVNGKVTAFGTTYFQLALGAGMFDLCKAMLDRGATVPEGDIKPEGAMGRLLVHLFKNDDRYKGSIVKQ